VNVQKINPEYLQFFFEIIPIVASLDLKVVGNQRTYHLAQLAVAAGVISKDHPMPVRIITGRGSKLEQDLAWTDWLSLALFSLRAKGWAWLFTLWSHWKKENTNAFAQEGLQGVNTRTEFAQVMGVDAKTLADSDAVRSSETD